MYSPFKMKGKSPMMKALIGKQNNLPEHLKAKIKAAPESPAKMKKKSPSKKIDLAPKAKPVKKDKDFKFYEHSGKNRTALSYPGEKNYSRTDSVNAHNLMTGGGDYVMESNSGSNNSGSRAKAKDLIKRNLREGKSGSETEKLVKPKTSAAKMKKKSPAKMKKESSMKMKKATPAKMKKASPTKMAKKSPAKAMGLKEKLAAQQKKRGGTGKKDLTVANIKESLGNLNKNIKSKADKVSNVISPKDASGKPQKKTITTKGGRIKVKNKTNTSSATPPPTTTTVVNPPASKGKVTYKQAWDKMSAKAKKEYKDFAQFKKAAEDYNKKKKK